MEYARISFSDVYKNLWALRNFEIEHVWHRAVFLSGLLLAVYAGYGGLVISSLTADKVHVPIFVLNMIAFFLTIVGVVLSCLWIMMAKGSKAWYEHYENAINAFVEYCRKDTISCDVFQKGVENVLEMDIDKCPTFDIPITDNSLLSTRGGCYSVSRVNVVVGHVSFCIFGLLLFVHLAIAVALYFPFLSVCGIACLLSNPMVMFLILIIVGISFGLYAQKSLKSSFLKERH